MASIIGYLLTIAAVRVAVLQFTFGYVMAFMQFIFYASIIFSFTLSLTGWLVYAHFKKHRPQVTLADYVGQPVAVEIARSWIAKLKIGHPVLAMIAGPRYSGRRHLANCIAGELALPVYVMDGAEMMLLGASALPKMLWYFWKVRRAAHKRGVVAIIDNVEMISAVPSLFGIRYVTALFRKFLTELRSLHMNYTVTERAINFVRKLAGEEQKRARSKIIFIGLTRSPYDMIPDLLSMEGIEETLWLGRPEASKRVNMVTHFLRKIEHGDDIDVQYLAKIISLLGAGDIREMIVRDAVEIAQLDGRASVSMADLKAAYYKRRFGGAMLSPWRLEEKRNVAYHEAGHGIVIYHMLPDYLVEGITIKARTGFRRVLPFYGATWSRTDIEEHAPSHKKLLAFICAAYGGFVAEEIEFGSATIGTGGDRRGIQRLNLMLYMTGYYSHYVRLPRMQAFMPYPDFVIQKDVEKKMEQELETQYQATIDLLKAHWNQVQALAEALLEREELTEDEVKQIIEEAK